MQNCFVPTGHILSTNRSITRLACVLGLLCLACWLPAQTKSFTLTILDKESQVPLDFCYVLIKGRLASTQTNEQGKAVLKLSSRDTLVLYQLGYHTRRLPVNDITSFQYTVFMESKNLSLDEVVVKAKAVDTLQQNNGIVFLDFEFYDDLILALIHNGKRYNSLWIMDQNGRKLAERYLGLNAEELVKDCFENCHILSADSMYQVYYDYQTIHLLPPYPISKYHQQLKPCVSYYANTILFKRKEYRELKNNYEIFDPSAKPPLRPMATVADSEAIRGFNTDFDLNYFLSIRRKGAGYQTSVDELTKNLDKLRSELVLPETYTRLLNPVQSEVKRVDSTYVLVDYTNALIRVYRLNGTCKKELRLDRLRTFKAPVQLDYDAKHLVFYSSDKDGLITLYRFNCQTMQVTQRFLCRDYPFVTHMLLHDGFMFFIHKDRSQNFTKTKIHKVALVWEKVTTE